MIDQITIHQLELFIAAARLKNFSRAAEQMAISQPAFSAQIIKLESILGIPLFERIGRRVELTEAGSLFEMSSRKTINALLEGKQAIDDMCNNIVGSLRIGASSTIANYLLPHYLGEFKKAHQECKIEMMVGNSNQIEQALLKNEIDMALVEGPVKTNNVNISLFKRDELVVIFAPEHQWKGKKHITIEQLEKEPLILREYGSGTRKVFIDKIDISIKRLNIVMELGNTEAIKKSVQANLGVGVMSISAVAHELKDRSLYFTRIKGRKCDRKLNVVLLENKYISNPLRAFTSFLDPQEPIKGIDN